MSTMKKRYLIAIVGVTLVLIVSLALHWSTQPLPPASGTVGLAGFPLPWEDEPALHKQAREQIIARCQAIIQIKLWNGIWFE